MYFDFESKTLDAFLWHVKALYKSINAGDVEEYLKFKPICPLEKAGNKKFKSREADIEFGED